MAQAPVPPVYKAMFSVPNIALESAMACRVFRGVKLGRIVDNNTTHNHTTLQIRKHSHPTTEGSANEYAFKSGGLRLSSGHTVPLAVEISKTMESGDPYGYPPGKPGSASRDGHGSV
jgi:hypothetical protein